MKPGYTQDEFLPLSGIQHFCFCRRQWALIHVEQQWKENVLTVEGKLMHDRVDDPFFTEVRRDVIITRSMPVSSYFLGLNGICDVVEFFRSPEGVAIQGRQGTYLATPVEYKHGREKQDLSDISQLCAQVICLEEMLAISIKSGFLFYGKTRRRVEVDMTTEIREHVKKMADEMHSYYTKGHTPQVKPTKACESCSLKDICLPTLLKAKLSASKYIQGKIDQE
jgi:CRISPR-associated exonuclease Cas4